MFRRGDKFFKVMVFMVSLFIIVGLVYILSLIFGGGQIKEFKPIETQEEPIIVEEKTEENLSKHLESDIQPMASPPSKNVNILLLGVDSRNSDYSGRTDAIVLLSYNSMTGKVNLIGIPRDTYVYLESRNRYDKINHSYAFEGIEGVKRSVKSLLGVDVDNYVVINFNTFMEVVDILGGIELYVEETFTEQDSNGVANAIKIFKGNNVLTGEEALAYVRMRKQDKTGDIGRNNRQKQVISSVMTKIKEEGSITRYIEIYKSVNRNIVTDLTLFDIMKYSTIPLSNSGVEHYNLEGRGTNIGGIYYYKPLDASIAKLTRIINGVDEDGGTDLHTY